MAQLPTGTVTFLLTDVEGSTTLWERHPQPMGRAIRRHHEIVHTTLEAFGGRRPEDQGEGDSVVGAFARATDAIACALELQLSLFREPWPPETPIRVRMAVHTGEIDLRDERNYFGPAINRCARLRAVAHGGQTVVSLTTEELVRDALPAGAYLRDLGPHRLKDLAHPERVFQLAHPDIPADFPPLKSLEAFPNNLPVQLTSFVGRERDIEEVKKALSTSRLVTLTGAAGCGKTRLALQVAAEAAEDYPDGVWFADLASITAPGLVAHATAGALGVVEEPNREMVETLADHLRPKQLMLIIDNCEHVLRATSSMVEKLLRTCPKLKILATSREPLGVGGETSWRVPSLSVPDPERPPAPEELPSFESAQLFVERALLASPDFEVDAHEAAAVGQICHRLDGIPLALELAAARTAVLSCEQIAHRLDDRFRLLTGGAATALERQQTLLAAVDWSYDLLTDAERALLRRLSVFVGGFTLEAAEEICAGDPVEGREVLDLLSRLVQKSLVVRERRPRAARYRLLETIRQYARDRLLDSGEGGSVRDLHRDWFVGLAERAEPEVWQGDRQTEWIETLSLEQDNLRAALEWSSSDENPEPLARLASALRRFWMMRGQATEGRRWVTRAVDNAGGLDLWLRGKVLNAAGQLAENQNDHKSARDLLEAALRIRRDLRDEPGIAETLNMLGNLASSLSELEEARDRFQEALEIQERVGDKRGAAAALVNLSGVVYSLGDRSQYRESLERALALNREVGDRHNEALVLWGIGGLLMSEDEYSAARPLFEEALEIGREIGARTIIVPCLGLLGNLAFSQGDFGAARTYWEEVADLSRQTEQVWAETITRGAIAYVDGDFPSARKLSLDSAATAKGRGEKGSAVFSMTWAGWSAEGEGDLEGARAIYEEAWSIDREMSGDPNDGILHGLAGVELALGDASRAAELTTQALSLSRNRRDRQGVAWSLETLAGCAASAGDARRAARLLGAADSLRKLINSAIHPHLVPRVESLLASVRESLGDVFRAEFERGAAMSVDEACAFALGEELAAESAEKSPA